MAASLQHDENSSTNAEHEHVEKSCTPLDVRVFSKRTLGTKLFFIDAIAVLPGETDPCVVELCIAGNLEATKDQEERRAKTPDVHVLSPKATNESKSTKVQKNEPHQHENKRQTGADIRVGDVLRLLNYDTESALPRPPRRAILNVSAFRFQEAWHDYFNAFPFHPPIWFAPEKQNQNAKRKKSASGKRMTTCEEDGSNAHLDGCSAAGPASAEHENKQDQDPDIASSTAGARAHQLPAYRQPALILQCHLPQAERVAAYFGGIVASNCTKDRLVYVFDDEDVQRSPFKTALLRLRKNNFAKVQKQHELEVPTFFNSVVHRVYFVNDNAPVFVSEADAFDYLHRVRGLGTEDPRQQSRKTLCFPREMETKLFEKRLGEWELKQASQAARDEMSTRLEADEGSTTSSPLPNKPASSTHDLCDTVCYADGLYFLGLNVPRLLIPERAKNSVPSAAYWKLLEIRDRYLVPRNCADKFTNRDLAIDLGASPGGWSYCLAEEFGIKRVLAVDPAAHMHKLVRDRLVTGHGGKNEMEEPVTTSKKEKNADKDDSCEQDQLDDKNNVHRPDLPDGEPGGSTQQAGRGRTIPPPSADIEPAAASSCALATPRRPTSPPRRVIEHWQMRSDAAIPKLAEEIIQISADEDPRKVAVFVCDMNDEPEQNVGQFEMCFQKRDSEENGNNKVNLQQEHIFDTRSDGSRACLVVITMKNVYRSKGEFATKVAVCRKILEGLGVRDLEEIHLFANTRLETTLVGQLV